MTENSWRKNLYPLFVSQFFYRAGTRSLIPFLPFFIKDIGSTDLQATALWSGWIFAAPFIVSFFTTPLWGTIGDKYGRKIIVLLSIAGFVCAQFAMSFSNSLLFLFAASSMQELFGGAYPAAVSLTSANSPREKATTALSNLQFANALGNVAGPLLGGVLADVFGYRTVFVVVAVVVLITSIPILFFVKETNVEKSKEYFSIKKNIKYFSMNKTLLISGAILLAYTLSVTVMRPNFSLFIQTQFITDSNKATIAGLLFSLFGATAAVSAAMLPLVNKYLSSTKILLTALFIACGIFLLLGFLKSIYLFAFALLILGLALGVILPLVFSLMSGETDQARKAGVMGIGSSFQMIGNLVGPITAGYVASKLGLSFTFLTAGIILLIGICFYLFWNSKHETSN